MISLRHFLVLAAAVVLSVITWDKVQAAPSCVPGVYGEQWPGSKLELGVRTDKGWHAYAWCAKTQADGTKVPALIYLTCPHGECESIDKIGARIGMLMISAVGGSKEIVFGAAAESSLAYRCGFAGETGTTPIPGAGTPRALACADLQQLVTRDAPVVAVPPPVIVPPPAPVYTHRVKPNGVLPDRPAYLLTNGVRGTKEVGRAVKDAGCDLTRPSLPSGADVWAEFGPAFEPGKVALCSRR